MAHRGGLLKNAGKVAKMAGHVASGTARGVGPAVRIGSSLAKVGSAGGPKMAQTTSSMGNVVGKTMFSKRPKRSAFGSSFGGASLGGMIGGAIGSAVVNAASTAITGAINEKNARDMAEINQRNAEELARIELEKQAQMSKIMEEQHQTKEKYDLSPQERAKLPLQCPHCLGAPDGTRFCPYCGSRLV